MNRPIEFRCWNKIFSIMESNDDIGFFNPNRATMLSDFFGNEERVMMQWTGLLDKNGVKIFEGDILRHTMFDKHSYTVVKFKKHSMNYTSGHGSSDNFIVYGYHCDVWFDFDHYEVVGNIFESPELLEEK